MAQIFEQKKCKLDSVYKVFIVLNLKNIERTPFKSESKRLLKHQKLQ